MHIPKILSAKALDNYNLIITFENKQVKKYNVTTLFSNSLFAPLKDVTFFKTVKIEKGGYAVSWNNAIDISEYELWKNGELME